MVEARQRPFGFAGATLFRASREMVTQPKKQ
ncbi:hypothetical protein VT84_03195 [Gemmata sp. SH-PL17]|nr:hypothetical protein VT84_03195 [Gemmata sp. SH-PL17]